MSKQAKSSTFGFILTVIITAAATFIISNHYLGNGVDFVDVNDQFSVDINSEKTLEYFRDRITLEGKNQDGPFILDIDLNRKENNEGKFLHYYYVNLFQNKKKESTQTSFFSDSGKITPNAFLPTFKNQLFEDLSTRESYYLSLNIDGKNIDIDLRDINGDFITKNTFEYTRYLSVGNGAVTIDDEKLQTNAVLEKSYSSDHSAYLYFPDIEKLESRTYRFMLWDEDENFYLVDDSVVSEDNPYYRNHTWILYKNAAPKYAQKFFAGEIAFSEDGKEKNWTVKIPELETDLILSTTDSTDANWSSGTIGGVARTKAGDKKVFGHFSYKKK